MHLASASVIQVRRHSCSTCTAVCQGAGCILRLHAGLNRRPAALLPSHTGYTRCNNACVPDGSIALGSQCCADASCAAGIGLTCLGETALTAGQCGCETGERFSVFCLVALLPAGVELAAACVRKGSAVNGRCRRPAAHPFPAPTPPAGRANCDANTANGCEITLATGVVVGDKIQNCGSCGSLALNTTTMTCTNGQPTCKDPSECHPGQGSRGSGAACQAGSLQCRGPTSAATHHSSPPVAPPSLQRRSSAATAPAPSAAPRRRLRRRAQSACLTMASPPPRPSAPRARAWCHLSSRRGRARATRSAPRASFATSTP